MGPLQAPAVLIGCIQRGPQHQELGIKHSVGTDKGTTAVVTATYVVTQALTAQLWHVFLPVLELLLALNLCTGAHKVPYVSRARVVSHQQGELVEVCPRGLCVVVPCTPIMSTQALGTEAAGLGVSAIHNVGVVAFLSLGCCHTITANCRTKLCLLACCDSVPGPPRQRDKS